MKIFVFYIFPKKLSYAYFGDGKEKPTYFQLLFQLRSVLQPLYGDLNAVSTLAKRNRSDIPHANETFIIHIFSVGQGGRLP